MRTIPADPGLILGNLISVERIEHLAKIAKAQKPLNTADRKLQNLIQAEYKVGQLYNQMVNFGVRKESLRDISNERSRLKKEMAIAAVNFVRLTVTAEREVRSLRAEQIMISEQIESPMDYKMSKLGKFNFSFDSLQFDVQYFQKQSMDSETYASQISSHVSKLTAVGGSKSVSATSSNATVMNQTENHEIEGTIVITATCTHQVADIFSPFVLEPRKALQAWNHTFPDDGLESDPASMFEAALENTKKRSNCLQLLSGTTKGSSFVGYVYILKRQYTDSSQTSESVTSSIQSTYEREAWTQFETNGFNKSDSFAKSASKLLSTSQLSINCSMSVVGVIPTISCEIIQTTVKTLKPSPDELMSHLSGIQEITQGPVNDSIQMANSIKRPGGGSSEVSDAMSDIDKKTDGKASRYINEESGGMLSGESKAMMEKANDPSISQATSDTMIAGKFIDMNNEHAEKTVMALGEITDDKNKVIDSRTMMTSLENYFEKVKAGDHGIPLNFYVKEIHKNHIAQAYMRKYYPNGALSFKDAFAGQLGQEQAKAAE